MANNAKETKDLTVIHTVGRDGLVVVSTNSSANGLTRNISVEDLFANTDKDILVANLVIDYDETPANSTALTVSKGQLWYDTNFIYIAIADNIVKRVAVSTFP